MHANHRTLRTSITALAILIGVGLSAPERAVAVEVLDQSQEQFNAGFSLEQGPTIQQTFRPAYANICAISVYMMHPASIAVEFIDVLCGQVVRVASGSTGLAYDWVKLDFVPPIAVTPDQEYAFRVVGAPAASCYLGQQSNPYDRGALYLNCTPLFGEYDAAFRTYAQDGLVPVRSTVWSDIKHLYR